MAFRHDANTEGASNNHEEPKRREQSSVHYFSPGMTGELPVLPLDRDAELRAANPIRGGQVVEDAGKKRARERAMLEVSRRNGPLSVIILGGAHQLTGDGVQVLRLTTKGYPAE